MPSLMITGFKSTSSSWGKSMASCANLIKSSSMIDGLTMGRGALAVTV